MGSHVGLVYRAASAHESSSVDDSLPVSGRPRIFPFFDMALGDAVVIDEDSKSSARSSAQNVQRQNGWKFKTKTLVDGSLLVKRVQ